MTDLRKLLSDKKYWDCVVKDYITERDGFGYILEVVGDGFGYKMGTFPMDEALKYLKSDKKIISLAFNALMEMIGKIVANEDVNFREIDIVKYIINAATPRVIPSVITNYLFELMINKNIIDSFFRDLPKHLPIIDKAKITHHIFYQY